MIAHLCGIYLDIYITNETGYLWGGFLGGWGKGKGKRRLFSL